MDDLFFMQTAKGLWEIIESQIDDLDEEDYEIIE